MSPKIVIFLVLLFSSFDSLAIPFFRISFGEFVLLYLLFRYFKIHISSLFKSSITFYVILFFCFLFFHQILASFVWHSNPYSQALLRPFFYSLISVLIYSSFSHFNINKPLILNSVRWLLLFTSALLFIQAFIPLFILPLYNPSFGITSLSFNYLPSGLTVEPSFVGGFLGSYYCLLIFVDNRFNFPCFIFSLAACFMSGSRTGVLILIFSLISFLFKDILGRITLFIRSFSIPRLSIKTVFFLFLSLLALISLHRLPRVDNFINRLNFAIDGLQYVFSSNVFFSDASVGNRLTSQQIYFHEIIKIFSFDDIRHIIGYGIFQSPQLIDYSGIFSQYSAYAENLVAFNFITQFFVELGLFSPLFVLCIILCMKRSFLISIWGFLLFSCTCNVANFFWSYIFVSVAIYVSRHHSVQSSSY